MHKLFHTFTACWHHKGYKKVLLGKTSSCKEPYEGNKAVWRCCKCSEKELKEPTYR